MCLARPGYSPYPLGLTLGYHRLAVLSSLFGNQPCFQKLVTQSTVVTLKIPDNSAVI